MGMIKKGRLISVNHLTQKRIIIKMTGHLFGTFIGLFGVNYNH